MDDPLRALEGERDRVVRRLRSMSLDAVPVPAVTATAQRLADLAAPLEGRSLRPVPTLAPYAAGDQVAVLATELLFALEGDGGAMAEAARTDGIEALRNLRAAL